MSKPKIEGYNKVLVVEGYSDLRFYAEFLEYLGKANQVFIEDMQGRSRLETQLKTLLTKKLLAEKTHIAVIVDADDDGASTADGLANQLKTITGRDLTEGAWSLGEPKLGFFVAPTPGVIGEIEDLVWQAWAADPMNAQAVPCVEQFIACMAQSSPSTTPQRIAKRRLGSMLAIRHEDDPRLGPAAQARHIINFDAPEFSRLRDFLSGF